MYRREHVQALAGIQKKEKDKKKEKGKAIFFWAIWKIRKTWQSHVEAKTSSLTSEGPVRWLARWWRCLLLNLADPSSIPRSHKLSSDCYTCTLHKINTMQWKKIKYLTWKKSVCRRRLAWWVASNPSLRGPKQAMARASSLRRPAILTSSGLTMRTYLTD